MYKKAVLFPENEILSNKIMSESDYNIIKGFGRMVTNFSPSEWNEKSYNIVKNGCKLKFSQNYYLLGVLLSTGDQNILL
tara:strand:- start:1758 stop:1994 length:237 start_codon:yes stop_codon:yes gene_type:complete